MVLLGVVSTYWVDGCAAGFPGHVTSSGKNKVPLVFAELRTAYMTVLGITADPRTGVSPEKQCGLLLACVLRYPFYLHKRAVLLVGRCF